MVLPPHSGQLALRANLEPSETVATCTSQALQRRDKLCTRCGMCCATNFETDAGKIALAGCVRHTCALLRKEPVQTCYCAARDRKNQCCMIASLPLSDLP